ncbi:hypothetical protein CHCC15292_3651 [Bacillus licheniformis]|nr:hypothetical protein CHCC15292_3651 [Bacillus licheniformis]
MPPGSRKPAAPRTVPAASLATVFLNRPSLSGGACFVPSFSVALTCGSISVTFFFIIKEMSSPLFWSTWTVSVLVAKLTEHASIPFIPAISCSIFCAQLLQSRPFSVYSCFTFSISLTFLFQRRALFYI